MAAGMTIKCPMCGEVIPVAVDVITKDTHDGTILARIDKTAADAHVQVCKGREHQPAANLPVRRIDPELAGRVHRFLDMRAYFAPGNRACTGCGRTNKACLDESKGACCGMCGEGNTHPSPGADKSCSEWADTRGA